MVAPGLLMGVLLLVVGLGGIAAYIVSILPPAVQLFAFIATLGAIFVARDIGLNDHIAYGVTVADAIAYMIRLMQSCCWQFAILLSIPGVTGADVDIVMRGLAEPDADSAKGAHKREIEDADVAKPSTSAPAWSPMLGRVLAPERSYSAAREWLQNPKLSISLGDQLQLYGLYQRAETENFTDLVAAAAAKEKTSWLEQAKLDAQKSCLGLSQAAARSRLAAALARADPFFAVSHPECAAPLRGDSTAIIFSIAERRLPKELPTLIASLQQGTLCASAAFVVATLLRAAWLRINGCAPKRSLALAATLGSVLSAYMLALVKGLPMEIHVAIARLVGSRFTVGGENSGTVATRLLQYLAILITPRASRSLFVQ